MKSKFFLAAFSFFMLLANFADAQGRGSHGRGNYGNGRHNNGNCNNTPPVYYNDNNCGNNIGYRNGYGRGRRVYRRPANFCQPPVVVYTRPAYYAPPPRIYGRPRVNINIGF